MPLIVEDGTAKPDANAYVSVQQVDDYLTLRNEALAWTPLTTIAKEALIVKASEYIDLVYRERFLGVAKTTTQSMQWPRVETSLSEMPQPLLNATAEYVLYLLEGSKLPTAPSVSVGGHIKRKTEKVGPLEETTEYAIPLSGTLPYKLPTVPKAELYLKPLLKGASSTINGEVYA
jgi:hypothetical protein